MPRRSPAEIRQTELELHQYGRCSKQSRDRSEANSKTYNKLTRRLRELRSVKLMSTHSLEPGILLWISLPIDDDGLRTVVVPAIVLAGHHNGVTAAPLACWGSTINLLPLADQPAELTRVSGCRRTLVEIDRAGCRSVIGRVSAANLEIARSLLRAEVGASVAA
ncbi:MAG TPA: hypothetical protein VFC03_08615 [Acidimicrobiales bacterium]|nr:hypothetical protein [Acidimicrobiales bacterium]